MRVRVCYIHIGIRYGTKTEFRQSVNKFYDNDKISACSHPSFMLHVTLCISLSAFRLSSEYFSSRSFSFHFHAGFTSSSLSCNELHLCASMLVLLCVCCCANACTGVRAFSIAVATLSVILENATSAFMWLLTDSCTCT